MSVELSDKRVGRLSVLIEESSRSTEEGVKYFVEPAEGTLDRAKSRRHHLVFGRRGSGKSSLLAKVAAELTLARTPAARVDLEPFKGHSYPDLLLSVLIASLQSLKSWLTTYATAPASRASWLGWFGKKPSVSPLDKKKVERLVADIDKELAKLDEQLHGPETSEVEEASASSTARSKQTDLGAGLNKGPVSANAGQKKESSANSSASLTRKYSSSKVDFLRRQVLVYQQLFDRIKEVSESDTFLLLDDLYHIRRSEQASVVDYFHSVAKGHGVWLKVGTIRHRSTWYSHGDPPSGMKLGDDADEINLDMTLEKYRTTKDFLSKMLAKLAAECELEASDFLTDGTLDRLVLASGGVARDLLGILRRSIAIARERSDLQRRPRVGVEDVNVAAGEYDSTKREELEQDTYEEETHSLHQTFNKVRDFCLEQAESNCFLVEQGLAEQEINNLNELVDLKLLHRIKSRVTVNTATQKGKLFEAFMLDLSQYSAARKKRDLKLVEFWRQGADQELRKSSLIYASAT